MEFNKKGQEVKYIKTEDLKKIREYLKYKNKITFLAFVNIGVNVGLRISDLSTLRFENIDRRSWTYTLIEKKTKKKRLIKFNAVCKKSIKELEKYYEELEYSTKEG
ncbi:tyrosine-type recombinase/integrase, partial [Fusobacterium polymorphum]